MPSTDDDLLARLNALKKSHISLSQNNTVGASPNVESEETDPILDLAARFKALGNPGKEKSAAKKTVAQAVGADGDVEIEAALPGNSKDADDDKTLEELLQELGPGDQWMVGKEDEQSLSRLLQEARGLIPPSAETTVGTQSTLDQTAEDLANKKSDEEPVDEDQDEQDADDYIAKVLAELDLERKYGNEGSDLDSDTAKAAGPDHERLKDDEPTEPSANNSGRESLSLPAAPTSQPIHATGEADFDRATAVDDALTARLNALSLPSAPSFAPAKKPTKVTKSLPKFTDEEIESWCIICNDDATVKCLGCDGDLYCRNCWKEGHIGESAGYEEKMHKWVKYPNQKP